MNSTDLVRIAKSNLLALKIELTELKVNVMNKTNELFPEIEDSEFIINQEKEEELNRH
jgi:hypothetical protein